ncbi:putative zinc ribbon protein [Pantoea dispersa]
MEKCDIAQTGSGKLIHAEDARRYPRGRWYCADCSCPLILRTVSAHRKAWFDHDPKAFASMKLRPCRFIQPDKTEPVTRTEEVAASAHRNDFRMMKCFLAHDNRYHVRAASKVVKSTRDKWYCMSCNCALIWHPETERETAWFEHDQLSIPAEKLKACAYLEPDIREEDRISKLKRAINWLVPLESITEWYCVYCSTYYSGSKFCANCRDGIYSIEAANRIVPPTHAYSAIVSDKSTNR